MDIVIGSAVISKSGRDIGHVFIVTAITNEYVYYCDGRTRLIAKPKKKKLMHIQKTKYRSAQISDKIINKKHIMDSDFRSELAALGFTKSGQTGFADSSTGTEPVGRD